MKVGVLALQGDVREHIVALHECGVSAFPVKHAADIEEIDALVIPGGESTTISKLARAFNLFEIIKNRIDEGMPVYGSCAGLILLSNKIIKQPETMSIHFHDKENSLMTDDYFANSLFNLSEVKGVSYMLLNLRDKYYLSFRKMFQLKFPSFLEYNIEPQIPRVIYINNTSNLPDSKLNALKSKWRELNNQFNVIALNESELEKIIPKSLGFLPLDKRLFLARFYILKDKGGVYVEPNFIPASISEFNYKYGYYGKLNKVKNLSDKLSLDTEIMAFTKEHSILRNMLLSLEKYLSKNQNISYEKINDLYLAYVYRYSDYELPK